MRAVLPGLDSANLTAASTFGSIEPGANCFWAMYSRASAGVRVSNPSGRACRS